MSETITRRVTRAKRRHSRARVLLALFGVSLAVLSILRVGLHAIWRQLQSVGPEAAWIVLPYATGTLIGAFPWRWLLSPSLRLRFRAVVASRFAASGANALLPFFGLAGEPSRLLWLPAAERPRGLAAIVLDRVLYNSGSALFLMLGALTAWLETELPPLLSAVAFAAAGAILAVTLGTALAAARFGIGKPIQRGLRLALGRVYRYGVHSRRGGFEGRASVSPVAESSVFGARVDSELQELLRAPRGPLWSGLATHFVGRAVLGSEALFALWILNAPADLSKGLVIASVPVATALVASSIPSQIGVQEASVELVSSLLGFAPGMGVAIVLLQRARQVAFIGVTLLLFGAARETPE